MKTADTWRSVSSPEQSNTTSAAIEGCVTYSVTERNEKLIHRRSTRLELGHRTRPKVDGATDQDIDRHRFYLNLSASAPKVLCSLTQSWRSLAHIRAASRYKISFPLGVRQNFSTFMTSTSLPSPTSEVRSIMPRAPKVTVKEESPKPYTPYTKKVVKVSGKDVERVGVEAFVFISLSSWQVRYTRPSSETRHEKADELDFPQHRTDSGMRRFRDSRKMVQKCHGERVEISNGRRASGRQSYYVHGVLGKGVSTFQSLEATGRHGLR